MEIDIITLKDLEKFKLELLEEIKEIIKPEPKKMWLTSKDVRGLLSCSPGQVQNLRVNGTLKGVMIGGKWYYKYEEIEKLFEN